MSNTHIIQKQFLELQLEGIGDFHPIADEMSDRVYRELLPLLAEKMDLLVDEKTVVKIDTIEVDIGTIQWHKEQKGMMERICDDIVERIKQVAPRPLLQADYFTGIVTTTDKHHKLELWSTYIATGRMPWNDTTGYGQKEWERFILAASKSEEAGLVTSILRNVFSDWVAFHRLIHTSSNGFLVSIAENTGLLSPIQLSLIHILNEIGYDLEMLTEETWTLIFQSADGSNTHWSDEEILLLFIFSIIKKAPHTDLWNRIGKVLECSENVMKSFQTPRMLTLFNMLKWEHDREALDDIYYGTAFPEWRRIVTNAEFIEIVKNSIGADRATQLDFSWGNDKSAEDNPVMATIHSGNSADSYIIKSPTDHKEDASYIKNAGLILVAPYLPYLFEALGFLKNDCFIDSQCQLMAVKLSGYLASGIRVMPEWELSLPKILCGLDPADTLSSKIELKDEYLEEADHLLLNVVQHWSALGSTSIDGLREGFLNRKGKITVQNEEWRLQVSGNSIDILLEQLPWGFGMIQFKWMNRLLRTEWTGYI